MADGPSCRGPRHELKYGLQRFVSAVNIRSSTFSISPNFDAMAFMSHTRALTSETSSDNGWLDAQLLPAQEEAEHEANIFLAKLA